MTSTIKGEKPSGATKDQNGAVLLRVRRTGRTDTCRAERIFCVKTSQTQRSRSEGSNTAKFVLTPFIPSSSLTPPPQRVSLIARGQLSTKTCNHEVYLVPSVVRFLESPICLLFHSGDAVGEQIVETPRRYLQQL